MKMSNMVPAAAEAAQPKAVQHWWKPSTESQQEGQSNPKEKGWDPWEWGNIHLNESEMDTMLQQAALESYKGQSQLNEGVRKHTHQRRANQGWELS